MKKNTLAMAMEAPAILVNPSAPAINAITKKMRAHLSIKEGGVLPADQWSGGRFLFPQTGSDGHRSMLEDPVKWI
jgi:hypothetical protein